MNGYLHFFVLIQKNEAKKNQDCACFAQKTCARLTKSFKLAATQLKHERFFTSISLVFWLTRQGLSGAIKNLGTSMEINMPP
jgi:hypothetical protein